MAKFLVKGWRKEMKMSRIEFREADELVSALQNDVEEIIFELRGEDKEKIKGEKDWYWLHGGMGLVDRVEYEDNNLCFYGGYGNRLLFKISDGGNIFKVLNNGVRKNIRGLRRLTGIIEDK